MSAKKLVHNKFLIIAYTVLLVGIMLNFKVVLFQLGYVLKLINPILYGIVFAFILNIPMMFVENKMIRKMDKSKSKFIRKLKRPTSIFGACLFIFGIITILMSLIIPQIGESVKSLVEGIQNNWGQIEKFFDNTFNLLKIEYIQDFINKIPWKDWLAQAGEYSTKIFPQVFVSTKSITAIIARVFIGFIISIYMLVSKEKLIRQTKRIIYAVFNRKHSDKIIDIGKLTNKTLNKFVSGQITEAFILGVICFIGMTVLGLPYAPLISVIIGVTNIIPIFGPIIGTIPCTFFILMIEPYKALVFIIFILIAQQIDSHVIYPKVVGNSVGLPGMWVLIAILVGGGLFGLIGMLLGVPVFAVIYSIIGECINNKLKEKEITDID